MTSTAKPINSDLSLVNIAQYDILKYVNSPDHPDIKTWQEDFRRDGVCVLEKFIAPEKLPLFVEEAQQLVPDQYHSALIGNAYLENIDPSLPEDHAKRITDRTSLGVIAYDQFSDQSLLKRLYKLPQLTEFLRVLLQFQHLYEYECPLGAINISVMRDNDYLRWHFDQSDFVVSIHLRNPEKGGEFEYVKNLRGPGQDNFEGVRDVLKGDRSQVKFLETSPGSLILFKGKNTLHRVTPIHGKVERLVALLGYAEKPGVTSTPYLRKIRYGRDS